MVKAGNAIAWLELKYLRAHGFDNTGYIVSGVECL
jgi:hypothetical protein